MGEWRPSCRLGPSSLAALGHEADVMRKYQHGPLWPTSCRPGRPARSAAPWSHETLIGRMKLLCHVVGYVVRDGTTALIYMSSETQPTALARRSFVRFDKTYQT